jgi:hypothetical protein
MGQRFNEQRAHCTKCDAELVHARADTITLNGKLPVELFAQPGSAGVHIVRTQCGTLVPLEETMLVLH